MPRTQYNAISKYARAAAKHQNISNVALFIEYMQREYTAHIIFFYNAGTREYVGYWKRGLTYRIHQKQ